MHSASMTLTDFLAQKGVTAASLGSKLGVAHSTVLRWADKRVPAERVRAVASETGIPPHVLRPDLFDAPAQEA